MKLISIFTIKEVKSFVMLCMPLTASFLAQKGMQFIDTVMMGWIGPVSLAAGALGTVIFFTILTFCRGILTALGVSIVHARGREQPKDIQLLLHQAIYLCLTLSLPSMLLIWMVPDFLTLIGQNPEVIRNTQLFLHGLIWATPGSLLFFVLREFISAFGLAQIIMTVSLISIPLTFLGNYVLIYGKWGFPELGIAGIGYATAFVVFFICACLLIYCRRKPILKPHLSFKSVKFDFSTMKSLLRIGLPSGIIFTLDMVTFSFAALMIGYFGVIALAAYQVVVQCVSVAFNFSLAISAVTALQVGHAYAAKDLIQVKRMIYLGNFAGLIISILFFLLFVLVPHPIVRLFLPDNVQASDVYSVIQLFLIIAVVLNFFDTTQIIIIGALRGLNDTFMPMLISAVCYLLIGIGCAYLLAMYTSLGVLGVWYGLILGIVSLCVVTALRLRLKLKG